MPTSVVLETSDTSSSFSRDDRIFLGEGLFETIRVVNGLPCFAELHWQRLTNAARALSIPFDISCEHWQHILLQQIKQVDLSQGGIKAILSGGSAARGLAELGSANRLMLQTFNYVKQSEPVRLVSATWFRDAANPVYQFKTVNYLEAICARRHAQTVHADDVLFYNMHDRATETTCANVFIVKDNQLFTPPLSDGVLPGITRLRIINFCAQEGIVCREQSVTRAMVQNAEAVFISNCLQGIRMVGHIDDHVYSGKHPLALSLLGFD